MLLNYWQHRGHTQNDTQNQVETDEKFVKPAVSSVYTCVISKTETNANQTSNVKENSSRQQGPKPILICRWSVKKKEIVSHAGWLNSELESYLKLEIKPFGLEF